MSAASLNTFSTNLSNIEQELQSPNDMTLNWHSSDLVVKVLFSGLCLPANNQTLSISDIIKPSFLQKFISNILMILGTLLGNVSKARTVSLAFL